MFSNGVLRAFVWIIAIAAMLFNAAVCYSRIFSDVVAEIKGQNMLIVNLGISDFLMGVGMMILASADIYYSYDFPSFSSIWRDSFLCKTAAGLSILSSEASVFFYIAH